MYKEALWFFLVVSFFAFGFDLTVIYHAPKITSAVWGIRLTFAGKSLLRLFLIYLTWQALKYPGHLGWQYWLVVSASLMTLCGLIMFTREVNATRYGRRRDDR